MDPKSLHKAASELLARALELPDSERRAFLGEQCRGNTDLEREVLSLFDHIHTDADEALLGSTKPLKAPAAKSTVIGDYRILELLGEGGMGQVYRAYKETPPRREVALKLIRAGMHSKSVLARFDQERNALTLMNHPNIAGILDAGETGFGQPYFVMELVRGMVITRYCDEHRLSIASRLELFEQVCEGVQHAHQKGIIHRDLKPGNILVVEEGGRRTVKIIDFGVAKATEQSLTEQTLFTELGAVIGTPEYMSPEQAQLTGLDIDTRTDVYALGVLLYELLTGALPFERNLLLGSGLSELQRIVREVDPPTPSLRLSRLERGIVPVARDRDTTHQGLVSQIRGDLDWIVMKALEKDRSRRYASPAEMAADLRRHARNEPVLAGPPGTAYRVRKFVRRHRLSVGAAAAAFMVLLGFAVVMTAQTARISRERDRAEQARADLQTVVDFQSRMIREVKPVQMGKRLWGDLRERVEESARARGRTGSEVEASLGTLDDLLQGVNPTDVAVHTLNREFLAPSVEQVNAQFADQPLIQAQLLKTLGKTYQGLSLYPESEAQFQQALEILRTRRGEDDSTTVAAKGDLAGVFYFMGRYAEAESLMTEVIRHGEETYGEESVEVVGAEGFMGLLLAEDGKYDKAEPLQRKAYERFRESFGPDHPFTTGKALNLGRLLMQMDRAKEAEVILSDTFKRVMSRDGREGASGVANSLAGAYTALGRYAEAESLHIQNFRIARRSGADDSRPAIIAEGNLAVDFIAAGDPESAEPYMADCLARARRVLGEDHPNTLYMLYVSGNMYKQLGRYDEAEQVLTELLNKKAEAGLPAPGARFELGCVKALRGARAAALDQLDRAVKEGFSDVEQLTTSEDLAGVRDDPAFPRLLDAARKGESVKN